MISATRTLRQARSIPSLKQTLHSSASTPKPSHLLSSSIQSRYSGLTVNALKNECRQRGLRLSGRKSELIDRLVVYETKKSFSTSKATELKGDDSHIDYWQIPKASEAGNKAAKPLFKIPIPPDAEYSVPEIDAQYSPATAAADATAAPHEVHVVSGNEGRVGSMNVDHGNAIDATASSGDSIPSRDKPFLLALAAAIGAWWGSKYVTKTEEHK